MRTVRPFPKIAFRVASALLPLLLVAALAQAEPARDLHYLSGTGEDDTVWWEFRCSEGRWCGFWSVIPVPSNWELQGFGRYDYGFEEGKHPEEGLYRHHFRVSEGWAGKRVDLVFEGVMTDAEVWVNGTSAGPVHQGGFTRFRYDVTELLTIPGPNRLEVAVREASADSSVNRAERDADYWLFGGIYRPVYLEAFPRESIRRVAVDARADGSLTVDVFLAGLEASRRIVGRVTTVDDESAGEPVGEPFDIAVRAGQEEARLEARFPGVRTWTAETPHLYRLEVELRGEGEEEPLHAASERIGFRTVEVRPGEGIFVNGTRVLLKGINRHSFWPSSGRTTSAAISRLDVELMKAMNLNAVRMSHYPPDTHFLDACDALGLYVLDELPGWHDAYATEVGAKLVEEMVVRDVNHPSVIFWDNGNEGGWNEDLDSLFSDFDPQGRPVLHPDSDHPFAGLDTLHYRSWTEARDLLEARGIGGWWRNLLHGPAVVLSTEALHGLYDGGHGAGLADFWSLVRASPRGGGIFLWTWLDEAVVRTDREGELDPYTNYAPDGVVGPYREKEASFFTVREIFSPVVLEEPEPGSVLPAAFDGSFRLRNDFAFTDLAEVTFGWRLLDLASPWEAEAVPRVVEQGSARPAPAPPGGSATLRIPLPQGWHGHEVLALSARDPDGREILSRSFPLRGAREVARSLRVPDPGGAGIALEKAAAEDRGGRILLSASGVEIAISKRTGGLEGITAGGRTMPLLKGPRLVGGPKAGSRLSAIESRRAGEAWEVEALFEGPLERLGWRLEPSGWLRLAYRYRLSGAPPFHGVGFDFPEEAVRSLRFRGRGPYRVWRNRLGGPTYGVWEIERNDTVTGHAWAYPEFQGFFADVAWARWETAAGSVVAAFEEEGRHLHNFTPRVPVDPRFTAPPFPETDLSILHTIPAIGTKFHPPENLGPSGRSVHADGVHEGAVWLFFRRGGP